MHRQLVPLLNEVFVAGGVDAVAQYVPAPDEQVDDELSISTQDGRPYPLTVQLSGNQATIVEENYDSQGKLESISMGKMRNPSEFHVLAQEVLETIFTLEPRSAVEEAPAPRS